jgi:hypothetical protein
LELFTQRAAAVYPGFTVTSENAPGNLLPSLIRVNETGVLPDTIGWNTCTASMLSNAVFFWCEGNAVDLVLGDVTVESLNLRPHCFQGLQ